MPAEPDDYQDTRPLRAHQERLHAQWGRPRAHYVANHVPAAQRVLLGLVSLTWVSWALIGVLSGHMFFFVGVPLHFSGIPALVFSLAALASAAACSVAIVDHHDRRDNELSYQRARRHLWWVALWLWVLAAAVGMSEELGLLPYTDGRVGLLTTQRLHDLLASETLQRFLLTHPIGRWCAITVGWCVAGLFLLHKAGRLHAENARRDAGVWLIALMAMIIPALASCSLLMLDLLAPGEITGWQAHEEEFRSTQAWLLSGLLTCVSATLLCIALFIIVVLQQLGVLPLPDAQRKS